MEGGREVALEDGGDVPGQWVAVGWAGILSAAVAVRLCLCN